MTLSLPADLEKFIQEQVNTGQLPDFQHVVIHALTAMRDANLLEAGNIDELRRAVKEGWDDLRAGRSAPWNSEEIKAEGRRLLEKRQSKKAL